MCVDTSTLQPLWIVVIGILFQGIISWTIIHIKREYTGLGKLFINKNRGDSSKNGCFSKFKSFVRPFLIGYQVISIFSIFLIDIIDINNKISNKNFSLWNNYNCIHQIIISY